MTGLVWEVKWAKDGTKDYINPNDADNTYTWYDPDPATNGGNAGTAGNGTDTYDFINDMNTNAYGGYSDWRMPTQRELYSIVDRDRVSPVINEIYFLNTVSSYYWSSSTCAYSIVSAWSAYFSSGGSYCSPKSYSYYVRAVRGGQ